MTRSNAGVLIARARRIVAILLFLVAVSTSTPRLAQAQGARPGSGSSLLSTYAPKGLAGVLVARAPLSISLGGHGVDLDLEPTKAGMLQGVKDGLSVQVEYEYLPEVRVIRWTTKIKNTTSRVVKDLEVTPLTIPMAIVPDRDHPRVRHLTGSFHYDAAYPPRAFRVHEERIMTHDHAKPIRIASGHGASAYDDSPELQFAVGPYGGLAGFYVAFEWSSRWFLEATWARNSFTGESRPEFMVQGNVGLTKLSLSPGEELVLPRVHLGFWEGNDWSSADLAMRRYVRDVIGARLNGKIPTPPVSYDHWFGIHQYFDVNDLKRQADKAAELGVEYFCLDAAWYPVKENFADGLGNWYPDPKKFPNGVEELSAHVRKLGMGFGIWQMIELATPGTAAPKNNPKIYYKGAHLRMDLQEGQEFALNTLRKWIRDWNVTWMRWEFSDPESWIYEIDPSGKTALAYMKGLYRVVDTIRSENPNLYIEGCQGGGTRMDWGFAVRTHGAWLNDHTNNPDVVRFMQTGASRFWPAHFLNMAVRAHRKSGDSEVFPHNLISRMVGTLSFNGDVAQWSPDATKIAAQYVTAYKNFRGLLDGPVEFPLGQPRSDREWDVVLVGEPGQRRLLFAFRLEGDEAVTVKAPSTNWKQILGTATAKLEPGQESVTLRLERNSSAVWELSP
jgi:alpha-galactosidase